MKDAEWRGLILQQLYDIRHANDGSTMIPDGLGLDGLVPSGYDNLLANVADQLKQHNLIRFNEIAAPRRKGRAKITAFGVDVVEGTKESAITITIDHSTNVLNSQHVQVGKGNIQNTGDIHKLNVAIDEARATMAEKEDAKSLLRKIIENPLLVSVLSKFSWGIGSG
jgi:hypothetical protein